MSRLEDISDNIKVLKHARDLLKEYYEASEFHKRKETNPQEVGPSTPEDEEIFKLLTAIQQLEKYVKQLQDEQFELLQKQE